MRAFKIEFCIWVKYHQGKQLNELYALSDVAMMNSKSESFALVIAEALSARRPIFINDNIMQKFTAFGVIEREKVLFV